MGNQVRQARGGFTLIELLLVLVILAVLAAIVVPKFTGRTEDAKIKAAITQISNIETALDAFEIDNGRYPTNDEGLNALFEAPAAAKNWKGPYMKQKVISDPWQGNYVYKQPGSHNPNGVDVYSTGPNGADGDDDDIGNWQAAK